MTGLSHRRPRVASACAAALLCLASLSLGAEPGSAVDFRRVHVPRGRLPDVPLGVERYVPMSAEEFERAVSRLGPRPAAGDDQARIRADRCRYDLAVDDSGRLVGRVSFDVVAAPGRTVAEIDIGAVAPGRCSLRTATGTGDAVVFGRPDGSVAVKTPEAGTYECEVSVGPARPGVASFRLPLVPALATSIRVRPSPGLRPVVAGAGVGEAVVSESGDGTWRIEFGPAPHVDLAFSAQEPSSPPVAVWTDILVRGGLVEVAAALHPRSPWNQGQLILEKPSGLRVVSMQFADRPLEWTAAADGGAVSVRLPRVAVGSREPVIVRAVTPVDGTGEWRVPVVRPMVEAWSAGGTRIEIDAALGVVGTATAQCVAVTPEIAARWPLPPRDPRAVGADAAATSPPLRPAVLHFEHQAADAALTLTMRPRQPQFDVARVTTVELSPGRVLGRAACDVRVVTGEAFAVTARIAADWIIDSVQLVEPFDLEADAVAGTGSDATEPDWRITRGRDGAAELRVGLAVAATPRRSLGLRVTGHRGGVPLGGGFRTADMDMVRFEGESADSAVIDFDAGPEAIVEVDGAPLGIFGVPPRLARLVEPGTLRGRLPGGVRSADRMARLVQRRPPIDVRVDVRLAARDERLAESFTMTCRPEAAAVDAIVVHFTEPMGDGLEWSMLEPAGGSLVARRLDAADTVRGDGLRTPACVESWLVEITPAFLGAATIRAARDVPFREPQPVPLAWVEGASSSRGTVLVRDTGPARPTVINRRLRQLPPAPAIDGQQPVLAEFAFSVPRVGEAAEAAAELVPAVHAEARAWAWSESISCRCHDSGRVECETVYDLENHGRDAVSLTVLPGRRVEEVLLDGTPVPTDSLDGGGTAKVPLPPLGRRLRLVVRTLVASDPRFGLWRIDPAGSTIDVPVLDHRLRLLLPPGLDVARVHDGYRQTRRSSLGLAERLLGARPTWRGGEPADSAVEAEDVMSAGFRGLQFVPVSSRQGAAGFVLVRRRILAGAEIIGGFLAFLGILSLLRRGTAAVIPLVMAGGLLALWLDEPWCGLARAVWWGMLCGCGWRLLPSVRPVAAASCGVAVGIMLATPVARAETGAVEGPLEVFLTPGDGGDLALVPERLFRAILQDAPPAADAVRIVRCRVLVEDAAAPVAWRLLLDVDADAGGSLMLDQGAGEARWEAAPGAGADVEVQPDGRRLRLRPPAAGSHRVEVRILPAVERRGRLELATIRLPPAAVATLELVDANGAAVPTAGGRVQCDRAGQEGPFTRVMKSPPDGSGFDLTNARRVRLVRPIDRRDEMAEGGLTAASENVIEWALDACQVRARFDVSGTAIVRAVVVTADPALALLEDAEAEDQTVRPLGDGRYLVERTAPEPGPTRIRLALRMPLVDPVGTFEVPGVWLEDTAADSRAVRLIASPDLAAAFATPRRSISPRLDEPAAGGDLWRYEAGPAVANERPPRLVASRRPQEVRGGQKLAVDFEADGVGLRLQARIDATSIPLVQIPVEVPPGCEIDRVTVRDDDLAAVDEGVRLPLDLQWSMTAADRLAVVMQQPRAGRYRLEVEGRLAMRPASRGRLPLMRAELAGNVPLLVSWSQGDRMPPAPMVEVPAGGQAPPYELADGPPAGPPAGRGAAEPASSAAEPNPADRVEQALVTVAIDDRGRLRGIARYDILVARPVIRLLLPPRTRLFDVLIDGHVVPARPVAADAWDVELNEATWPRSLMLLFAGDCGPLQGNGQPIRLQPPSIDGLPVAEVLWTIDPPADKTLRLAEPARLLDEVGWQRSVNDGRGRVAAAFAAALAADTPDADRLRAFAADRGTGAVAPLERSWERALEPRPGTPSLRAAAPGDGGLTVRPVPRGQRVEPLRTSATMVLVAMAVWGWIASRPGALRPTTGWATIACRWLLLGGGIAWGTTLEPSLPGWLLAAMAAASLVRRRINPPAVAAVPPPGGPPEAFDSTRALPAS